MLLIWAIDVFGWLICPVGGGLFGWHLAWKRTTSRPAWDFGISGVLSRKQWRGMLRIPRACLRAKGSARLGTCSLGDFHPPSLCQKGWGFSLIMSARIWMCVREIFCRIVYQHCRHVVFGRNPRMKVCICAVYRTLGLLTGGRFFCQIHVGGVCKF